MKKICLMLLLATMIIVTITGCGGSGSPKDSNNAYVGEWQGTWAIPALFSTGREIITISDSGNLSGKLYSPEEAELAVITGIVEQNGTFSATYRFSGADNVTLNGAFNLKNGVLTGTTKHQYNGKEYDMVFTLTTRTVNQYAGVWEGNWTAGGKNGIGNCTIGMDGLITGTIEYPDIGTVNINGISDNKGFSFSYEYNSEVYSVIGTYDSFVNSHLKGTFIDAFFGNGTYDIVKQ